MRREIYKFVWLVPVQHEDQKLSRLHKRICLHDGAVASRSGAGCHNRLQRRHILAIRCADLRSSRKTFLGGSDG